MDYDLTQIPANYHANRRLSKETAQMWMEAIGKHVQVGPGDTILDLGCGTGRFSSALAESFAAKVIGVDPSSRCSTTPARLQWRSTFARGARSRSRLGWRR